VEKKWKKKFNDFEPSLILNNSITHTIARVQTSVPISNLHMKAQLSSDILDTTKRCTNGRCLLRKYNEIVATEEVLEYLRTLKLGRFIRNASERIAPNYAPGAMVERLKCSDRAKDNKCPAPFISIAFEMKSKYTLT
jgi:hypothetical protein